ncbi:MAG: hypothetical protein ACLQJ7_13630 [Syntrophobacteraceae bacterium]
MKGKVLSIITAILFGATMVASPIVFAAGDDTMGAAGTEEKAPAKKKPAKTKKTTKEATTKKTSKKTSKKKTSKKKEAAAPEKTE